MILFPMIGLGLTRDDPDPKRVDRFWCSALVGYIYTQWAIKTRY